MRIIFSRKGIDSSFGNCASAIMPDGKLCWIPIPETNENKLELPTYSNIFFGDTTLGNIIEDLSSKRITSDKTVHLDPDIFPTHRNRRSGWKPVFGQTGAAESHLRNKFVKVGDVFLFFGWFRQCEFVNGTLKYKKSAPNLHLIYGWMQIGSIIKVCDLTPIPEWLKDHPHLVGQNYGKSDTLYFSSDKLHVNGMDTELPGVGFFENINDDIVLTAKGCTRSIWNLPNWMYPSDNKPPLSYNEKLDKWTMENDSLRLKIASRGQEFVLDTEMYPEAHNWLINLIKSNVAKDETK